MHASPSVARAVVFYGRVATRTTRAANLAVGASADESMWRECAEAAYEFVVAPWRRAGHVDVFVQSWNVELAKRMDAFWKPVASDHAQQNTTLRCPIDGLKLCERTMWALLGMKRALALRARSARSHAVVFVARHDVYWRTALPPLLADDAVRLWLPFDCQLAYCRDGPQSAPSACAGNRIARNATRPPSDWITLAHSKSRYYGQSCEVAPGRPLPPLCSATVLIDWWFASDTAIADGFGATFDDFAAYSKLVKGQLDLSTSAPHQYWGLHFFQTLGLRRSCQVGHVAMHALDFTLARFIPEGIDARSTCTWSGEWQPYWRPPAGAACDAAAIPGYLTMCPGVPPRPLLYKCEHL